jgi:putative DNA methylase
MGQQMMAIVCTRPGTRGKLYLSADDLPEFIPDDEAIRKRIDDLCKRTGLTAPDEPIEARMTGGICLPYGLTDFGRLFTPRQMLCLLTFAVTVREAIRQAASLSSPGKMPVPPEDLERAKAVGTYLATWVDRIADKLSTLARWDNTRENCQGTFGRQALPMVWDFVEPNPFGEASGGANGALDWVCGVAETQSIASVPVTVTRGSATSLPWPDAFFDAVITDPPYYDNVDYAKLSDFFYVWLKRTIGHLYSEHFTSEGTPKKNEAVVDPVRHGGEREQARQAYEQMMAQTFAEANRVLRSGGQMVVVYAHKTTLGWATLVDALRQAGFTITEAWPLNTEMRSRLIAMASAALASSIFLVARKREGAETGSYGEEVRPELEQIVRERVDTLWKMGITGADLKIAAVGAGMRAFTRFARVEYANGEEVPAEKFLAEVEGIVQEFMLERIFGVARSGVAAVDSPSRFYVLWRYTYKAAEMDAGEAIVFTYGQNVELDLPAASRGSAAQAGGRRGLATGRNPLVEKKKGKYRLYDFTERGDDEKLGLPADDGTPAPLIDVLHRILWLIENEPRNLNRFLDEARPDRERLRLVAQALAGTALAGRKDDSAEQIVATTAAEQAALKKLVANWRALIDQRLAADQGTLFDTMRKPEANR